MPRAFGEEERRVIQQRLVDQGERLFSTYGLKKTSVDELAAAVGISKGAFYLFYGTKEELFMDAVERVEARYREQILALLNRPGPTPRARLAAALKEAVSLWKKLPLLQLFTSADYELIYQRVPEAQIRAHLESDRVFLERLAARCDEAGMPLRASLDDVSGLMYVLFLSSLHQDEFGPGFASTVDLLVELAAAFCLGEVTLEAQELIQSIKGDQNGSGR